MAVALATVPLALVVARCTVSEALPWIVQGDGGPWIAAPLPVSADLQQWGEREVVPTRFALRLRPTAVAGDAALRLRALGDVRVSVAGRTAGRLTRAGARGRAAGEVPLGLAAGASVSLVVEVRNATGPALLSVSSRGIEPAVESGTHWSAARGEAEAVPAAPADDTRRNPRALAVESPGEALRETGPLLAALALLGAAGFGLARRAGPGRAAALFDRAAPFAATAVWLGPFAARVLEIPMDVGFDAAHHLLYTQTLLGEGRLPDAAEGWSTYHPPLFYALSAALLSAGAGASALRWLTLAAGVASVWIAWGLARRLARRDPGVAGLAALFAAVLPMNLYSAAYYSNEALHAALAGAGLLCAVALLLRERTSLAAAALLGVVLGAAALTKFTVLVVVPVALFFLGWKLLAIERVGAGRALAGVGVAVAAFVAVAGWFYLRTHLAHGTPVMGNWALPGESQRWWQQPGFHTPAYLLGFGEALVHPYLSGFVSFWDALYSTAWGDGFVAGRTDPWRRHPHWNYAFMSAGYWVALPALALLATGVLCLVRRALRAEPAREALALGFVLLGAWAVTLAFATLVFDLAFFAQAKAPYGLLLTAPAALCFATGYRCLDAHLGELARAVLAGWLTAFAATLLLGFVG